MLALYVHATQRTRRLRRDVKAVTAIEYGLLAALIAVGISVALTTLAGDLSTVFTTIGTSMTTAVG